MGICVYTDCISRKYTVTAVTKSNPLRGECPSTRKVMKGCRGNTGCVRTGFLAKKDCGNMWESFEIYW